MSTLWTPSGEHRVEREPKAPPADTLSDPDGPDVGPDGPDEEGLDPEAQVAALRQQLANTPPETVLANHCYGLFELGAIYLSAKPPQFEAARLAIDALGFLVDGLGTRLGEASEPLRDALAQIRLGYVQVEAAERAAGRPTEGPGAEARGG